MDRDDVFIANVLKSRPPENRDPQPDEIEACRPYLERQVELIEPRVICTLGNFATKLLTGSPQGITRVHGEPQERELGGAHGEAVPDLPPGGGAAHAGGQGAAARGLRQAAGAAGRAGAAASRAGRAAGRPPPADQLGLFGPSERPSRDRQSSAEETEALGAELAGRLEPGDVVLVSGELGAGKTTFVRGAARALGVEGPVTSPTFTIGHVLAGRVEVAHLDLYRLASLEGEDPQLLDDYLTPERIGFVEWPAVGEAAVPRVAARVRLEHAGGDRRTVEIA